MATALKYTLTSGSLVLSNGTRLTPRKEARLAAGSPEKYYAKLKKAAIVGTIIITVILIAIVVMVASEVEKRSRVSPVAGRVILMLFLPNLAFFVSALVLMSLFRKLFSPSFLDYGQNVIDTKEEDRLSHIRKILSNLCFFAFIGSIGCDVAIALTANTNVSFVALFVAWMLLFGVMAILASVSFFLREFNGVVCKSCKTTNAFFKDGSYRHDYGELESRVVNASPTSYTAGTVYDNHGNKVGTVTGNTTTYTYAEGRSYKVTYYKKCACCGEVESHTGSGFEVTRRYKV